jgi:tRNA uridine 5-carbamoylmethylation protein Kti12
MNIQKLIKQFLKEFSKMTKQEADYIEKILKWDEEKKTAFILAKKIFDEKG